MPIRLKRLPLYNLCAVGYAGNEMKRKNIKQRKNTIRKIEKTKKFPLFWVFVGCIAFAVITTNAIFLHIKPATKVCANSISCIKDLSGKIDLQAKEGIFNGKTIAVPQTVLADTPGTEDTAVLGQSIGGGAKHIYVDLTNQRLYAFQGNKLVFNFLISSGKWNPTPTGVFTIWIKLRATTMIGGSGADYYNLPNVPYTMYFYNNDVSKADGYSIHGAYWHHNFGHPMSHGCVNVEPSQAKELYDWSDPPTIGYTTYATSDDPGTPITIYGTAPAE